MSTFPEAAAWRKACVGDASLAAWAGPWSICFAIASGADTTVFNLEDGKVQPGGGEPAFTLSAPAGVWAKFLLPIPPRHHHGLFAMHYRLPEFVIQGDQRAFMQHVHVARRILEVGKWLTLGNALPVPLSLAPRGGPRAVPKVQGGYVPVTVGGTTYQIYYETAGSGRDVLCMHTAGSDGRQFHGLMADERITNGHRLVSFDLPWHGKSLPPEGAVPGSWRLNTDLYVDLIMGFIAAAGLNKPIALGASMSGEICLELAYRHPDSFGGIVACEACDKINQRQTTWAVDPKVNSSLFVPEWIRALSAPQSPAEYQETITWHYSQGGASVFYGDIAFYSGDWDGRERVGRIDTNRCRLFMLTGEYDYSCTIELSEATAAKIPGVTFRPMPGIGHFPFAENPRLFADYLLPVLGELAG
ncbi:alpha/beta fold hydrolase [Acidisphaera sp. S103]|uniref:alpha/beta fold hydrolase n=1 Tax=Acidisphaera sp. S103 TaxID=1747223 RepID=UPI00131B66A9|nr:alpha/beta hydrolase [Acidisphaera sp. S103]